MSKRKKNKGNSQKADFQKKSKVSPEVSQSQPKKKQVFVEEPIPDDEYNSFKEYFFTGPLEDFKKREGSIPHSFYRLVFAGSAILIFLLMIFMGLNSGINGDDSFQHDYSDKLLNFYSTMGQDSSALFVKKGQMHFYGGFFDITTGVANKVMGNDVNDHGYNHIRHIMNVIFGFLAMIFVALILRRMAGWKAAVLGLLFMFLSPRFLGHSLMNPKDIPFAAGYIMALYFMLRLFETLPKPKWSTVIGLGLGMGIALSTRAGGVLLFAYFGLFALVNIILQKGIKNIFSDKDLIIAYLKYCISAALIGLFVGCLFWPYALVNPFENIMKALTEFSKLSVHITVLFDGMNIKSNDIPWHYPVTWISKTIPLFVLIGFPASLAFAWKLWKERPSKRIYMFAMYFAAIFPLAYIIYKESNMHDGWRHLTFVYAPMVVMATMFWITLEKILAEKGGMLKKGMYVLLGLLMLESAVFIVRNTSFPYVYFNPIAGGMSGAFGNYETDYWGVSTKQAVDWLEDEGLISPDMPDTLYLGTTFHYNIATYVKKKYGKKLIVRYVRFNERYEKEWDYGIFPSRFIKGNHLNNGTWPNSRTIHSITANGVPMAAIETAENPNVFEAEKAIKKRDFNRAIELYKKELQNYPDNELAAKKLAWVYSALKDYNNTKSYANKALEIAPLDPDAILYRGISNLGLAKSREAKQDFLQVLEINDDYPAAYYYYALILKTEGDIQGAFNNAKTAIEKAPKFKLPYQLIISIFEERGDTANANKFRQAMSKL